MITLNRYVVYYSCLYFGVKTSMECRGLIFKGFSLSFLSGSIDSMGF
jgi:hypothetical protein